MTTPLPQIDPDVPFLFFLLAALLFVAVPSRHPVLRVVAGIRHAEEAVVAHIRDPGSEASILDGRVEKGPFDLLFLVPLPFLFLFVVRLGEPGDGVVIRLAVESARMVGDPAR